MGTSVGGSANPASTATPPVGRPLSLTSLTPRTWKDHLAEWQLSVGG